MYQVLLVDDEPILQLGIRRMLEGAADYQICASARNGEEALQYLQAHPVDIVMTDLKMPVMDGITLIKELRRRQLPVPVIVLSNYSDFELVREALTEGASDYVLKLDLTAQTLLKHLDKLAANLNAVRRTQEEQLPPQEQGELLQSRLRTFFLELQTADDHIPDLPPGLRPPFLVFTVYFQDDAIKPGRLRRVLPHMESVLRASLNDMHIQPVILHHNALLCLASTACGAEGLQNQLHLLQRQLATFFSAAPVICFCANVGDLPCAKEASSRCAAALALRFHGSEAAVIHADAVSPAHSLQQAEIAALLNRILDALHAGKTEDALTAAHTEFLRWQQLLLEPACAKRTCLRILDSIRYSVASAEVPEQFLKEQQAVEAAAGIWELEQHFSDALTLLSQCKGRPFEAHKREVQEALRYLHTNYTEKMTLDSLADATCLNRSYLCRVFKKDMGVSIFSYLNELRMKRAAELLLQRSDRYIKEIAAEVGIDDPFYFTRRFKEYYGVSPKEYIEQNNQ